MELDELKASWQGLDRRIEERILRRLLTETICTCGFRSQLAACANAKSPTP